MSGRNLNEDGCNDGRLLRMGYNAIGESIVHNCKKYLNEESILPFPNNKLQWYNLPRSFI